MGRQTVDRLNPETADPPNSLERKRKAFARRENTEDGDAGETDGPYRHWVAFFNR